MTRTPIPLGQPGGRREIREILALALPLAAAQIAQILMGITDSVMMGRLGTDDLAAGSLGANVAMFLVMVTQGVLSSMQPLIAHARGAGQTTLPGRILASGMALALMAALPIVLILTHIDLLLGAIGEPRVLAHLAHDYQRAFAWGVPAALLMWTLRNYLSATERPRVIMIALAGGALLNLGLNRLLIFGGFGLPAFGIAGSGYATALVMWLLLATLAGYMGLTRLFPWRDGFPDAASLRHGIASILRLGWPIGGAYVAEMGLFSGAALVMGYFGPIAVAANQICIGVAALTFMVPMAIGQAAMVRIGLHAGGRNIARARDAGRTAILLGIGFMMTTAVVIWLGARHILGLYLDPTDPHSPAVMALGMRLLALAALFQVFDGTQTVCLGVLRGLKDTRVPFYAGILAYWGLGMPIGLGLAFLLGFGPEGIWWGFVVGLVVIAAILPLRFIRLTGTLLRDEIGPQRQGA
jgi:MATE family multidrug resistance protein